MTTQQENTILSTLICLNNGMTSATKRFRPLPPGNSSGSAEENVSPAEQNKALHICNQYLKSPVV